MADDKSKEIVGTKEGKSEAPQTDSKIKDDEEQLKEIIQNTTILKGLIWKFYNHGIDNSDIDGSYVSVWIPKPLEELVSRAIKKVPGNDRQALSREIEKELAQALNKIGQENKANRLLPILKRYADFMLFVFQLVKYKDEDTCEETLEITCYKEVNSTFRFNGKILTNLIDLATDIKGFLRFGVALQDVEFFSLASLIKQRYMELKESTIKEQDPDSLKNAFFSSLAEYVSNNSVEERNDLYYIPVLDFNGLLEQIGVEKYRFNSIRHLLTEEKYIVRGKNSISVTFRGKDKKIYRAIAFNVKAVKKYCKEHLDIEIPEKVKEVSSKETEKKDDSKAQDNTEDKKS